MDSMPKSSSNDETWTETQKSLPEPVMKSSWRSHDRATWNRWQRRIVDRGLYYCNLNQKVPVHIKTAKIPNLPDWQCHRWILYHAAIPMLLQQAFTSYTGVKLNLFAVWIMYSLSFAAIGVHQIQVMRKMAHRYGFFDGEKARDDVPDNAAGQTLLSLVLTVTMREAMCVLLTYRGQQPLEVDWIALPLEVFLYAVVLDFWYYWYHRVMHEFADLWPYHRTHQFGLADELNSLTKHPTALLTLFAGPEQELFDIVGIPMLTFISLKLMGLPMGYYEWWISNMYIVFTELIGHSGLRIQLGTVATNWALRLIDCDLVIEDHDLHHRVGWKHSSNYGKQTRLWDRAFGTCHQRIESTWDKIDYVNQAYWPIA